MEECGICRLLERYRSGEEAVRIVYESDAVLAVHSTKPFAQTHVFIALKEHIPTIFDLTPAHAHLVLEMGEAIRAAANEVIATDGAARLEMYLGEYQNTRHVHCHVVYDPSID